jgi:FkbM family methyltransferase
MNIKHKAFVLASKLQNTVISILGMGNSIKYRALYFEEGGGVPEVDVKTKRGTLKFYCPGRYPLYRAETFFTKEPETLEWIDGWSNKKGVFWDIGANVGIYSLYAAQNNDMKIFSFEPTGLNYFVLVKNIEINSFDNICPMNIALDVESKFDYLNMGTTIIGKANFQFGRQPSGNDLVFREGKISHTLDQLVYDYGMPCPNYIKIDVDGLEARILIGGTRLLNDANLETVLVETDKKRDDSKLYNQVFEVMSKTGFECVFDGETNSIYKRLSH